MNAQRTYIYKKRNELLDGVDISEEIKSYIVDIIQNRVEFYSQGLRHPEQWDLEGLRNWFKQKFTIDLNYEEINPVELSYSDFVDTLEYKVKELYQSREEKNGPEDMRIIERLISLQVIDNKWRDHLLEMDQLRDGIWAMGYGERNPLVEYKIEGSRIFNDMIAKLKEDIIEFLMKVEIRRVEEEIPASHLPAVNEYHDEVDQFGSGGIPVQQSYGKKSKTEDKVTEGGVKRKKVRRSRRN